MPAVTQPGVHTRPGLCSRGFGPADLMSLSSTVVDMKLHSPEITIGDSAVDSGSGPLDYGRTNYLATNPCVFTVEEGMCVPAIAYLSGYEADFN